MESLQRLDLEGLPTCRGTLLDKCGWVLLSAFGKTLGTFYANLPESLIQVYLFVQN